MIETPIRDLEKVLLSINHPKRVDYGYTIYDPSTTDFWPCKIKVYSDKCAISIYYSSTITDGIINAKTQEFI